MREVGTILGQRMTTCIDAGWTPWTSLEEWLLIKERDLGLVDCSADLNNEIALSRWRGLNSHRLSLGNVNIVHVAIWWVVTT
jgi:hypothetical protein